MITPEEEAELNELERLQDDQKPFDASNPRQVRKRKQKAERISAERLAVVKSTMSTPAGRAWYYDWFFFCGVFEETFRPDPLVTAYLEGLRKAGMRMYLECDAACPELILVMNSEAKQNKELNNV
jgi:hypothetical protein